MKKFYLSVALVLTIASSMMLSSCIGSFALFNKLKDWNSNISSKFVNELVFFAFWIVPVYEVSLLADALVINSIEFWSGSNPVAANDQVIDGKDARYLVHQDREGYTITNLSDNSVVKFNHNELENSWSIEANGKEQKLFAFVDDTHINILTPGGEYKMVELSEHGVLAYQEMVSAGMMAMK
ncbi:MAG: DUF3332 domain-containing protein [Bacteroidaceae bacterium]|nr:DUF3332 domain-containing protein [Bacteroidaceae bacterium]